MHQSIELALLYRLVYHALWVDSIVTELGGEYKSTMFRIFGLFSTLFSQLKARVLPSSNVVCPSATSNQKLTNQKIRQ